MKTMSVKISDIIKLMAEQGYEIKRAAHLDIRHKKSPINVGASIRGTK